MQCSGMKEFPVSQIEFERWFSSEEKCRKYLEKIRWPQGFECPRCKLRDCWRESRGRIECKTCAWRSTLTAGTIFEGSHLELMLWFRAIWWLINQKHGVSAYGLQKGLGLGSYRTAWLILQKLRKAMVYPERKPLTGKVEVDEAFMMGVKRITPKHRANPIVMVGVEDRGKTIGRIRLKHIQIDDTKNICGFIQENVLRNSTIISDGERSYENVESQGYHHICTPSYARNARVGVKILPKVNLVISLLKTWIRGTHHGRIGPKHLQGYLDEFAFRFNRRNSESRGLLFRRMLESAVCYTPTTYKQLVNPQHIRQWLLA